MEILIKQAQAGDTEALVALWERTKAFALAVSRRYYPTTFADSDDLQQCAYLGFHTAVMQHTGRYDFLALVRWCTQRECQKLLDLYGSRRQLRADSLDIILPDGESTPADLIEDDSLPEHYAQIITSEIMRDVRAAVAELPDRERMVLVLRYGLEDGVIHPQHEIAERLDISRSYVSRSWYCKRCPKAGRKPSGIRV